jgi:hypothetical protein
MARLEGMERNPTSARTKLPITLVERPSMSQDGAPSAHSACASVPEGEHAPEQ